MAVLFNFSALVSHPAREAPHYSPATVVSPAGMPTSSTGPNAKGSGAMSAHWIVGADGRLEEHWESGGD
jgi:hypothetical protein